jgi:hypothetical protein
VVRHGDFTIEPPPFKQTADESEQVSEHWNALFSIGLADGTSGNSSATPGGMSAQWSNALLRGALRYNRNMTKFAAPPLARLVPDRFRG